MGRPKKIVSIIGISTSKPTYYNTSDGVAYYADLFLNDEKIGYIENSGTGGTTDIRIIKTDMIKEFYEKVKLYFNVTLGFKTDNVERYSLEYTFAEHLLDMKENGYVTEDLIKLGMLR